MPDTLAPKEFSYSLQGVVLAISHPGKLKADAASTFQKLWVHGRISSAVMAVVWPYLPVQGCPVPPPVWSFIRLSGGYFGHKTQLCNSSSSRLTYKDFTSCTWSAEWPDDSIEILPYLTPVPHVLFSESKSLWAVEALCLKSEAFGPQGEHRHLSIVFQDDSTHDRLNYGTLVLWSVRNIPGHGALLNPGKYITSLLLLLFCLLHIVP